MGTASTSPDTMEAARLPGLSITVEKNPPEARLLQLGVKSWPKYIYINPKLSASLLTHSFVLYLSFLPLISDLSILLAMHARVACVHIFIICEDGDVRRGGSRSSSTRR
jgi:hypothetical protein